MAKLKRNQFYVKTDVTSHPDAVYDTNVSSIFTDLFDGQNPHGVIRGGLDTRYYISDFPIGDTPPFGDGKLVGLKQYYYIPSGGLDLDPPNSAIPPRFKAWKVDRALGGNEGKIYPHITGGDKKDDTLTVIQSTRNTNVGTYMVDNFSQGQGEVTRQGTRTIVESQSKPYVFITQQLVDLITHWSGNVGIYNHWTVQKLKEEFGTESNRLGGWIIMLGRRGDKNYTTSSWFTGVGLITQIRDSIAGAAGYLGHWDPVVYKPKKWAEWSTNVFNVPEWRKHDLIDADLLHYDDVYESAGEDTIVNSVSPADSMFCNVHTSFNGLTKDDGDPLLTAQCTYSKEKSLDGGHSAKMHTLWSGEIPRYGRNTMHGNSNAHSRQEVVASVKIPLPVNIGDTIAVNGASVNPNAAEGDNKYTSAENDLVGCPEISTDVFIEHLQKTYVMQGDASGSSTEKNMSDRQTFARGFAITFSTVLPDSTMTFYDFVKFTNENRARRIDPYNRNGQNLTGIMFSKNHFTNTDNMTDWGTIQSKADQRKRLVGSTEEDPYFATEGIVAYPLRGDRGIGNWTENGSTGETIDGSWNYGDLKDKITDYKQNLDMVHWSDGIDTDTFQNRCFNIPEGSWLNFRFKMSTHKDSINMRITDKGTNQLISFQELPLLNPGMDTYPTYMTFWLLNFPDVTGHDADPSDDDCLTYTALPLDLSSDVRLLATGETKQSTVYIDNVTLKYFNRELQNATVTSNNLTSRTQLFIPGDGVIEDFDFNEYVAPTYIAIGLETQSDFDQSVTDGPQGNGINFLWSGYGVSDVENNVALGVGRVTSTEQYVYLGHTNNGHPSLALGNGDINENFYYGSFFNEQDDSSPARGTGLNVHGSTGVSETMTGVHMVNDDTGGSTVKMQEFSRHGIMKLDYLSDMMTMGNNAWTEDLSSANQSIPVKRECIWASARVLAIDDKHTLKVDDASIFNLPDDTEYVLYRYGGEGQYPETSNCTSTAFGTFTLDGRPTGTTIKFKEDLRGGAVFQENLTSTNLDTTSVDFIWNTHHEESKLFISPKKYWFVFQIWPFDSAGNPAASRGYQSICSVNKHMDADENNPKINYPRTEDIGATYNEWLYTEGNYTNTWNLSPGAESNIVVSEDYGFGAWEADTFSGGHVQEISTLQEDRWTVVDLDTLLEVDKLQAEDIVSLMYTPYSPAVRNSLKFLSTENIDNITGEFPTTYKYIGSQGRPFQLAVYEDDPPVITNFSVAPSEMNPSFPTYSWSIDADDAWYGFLIIDNDQIHHQYHKAGLYVPCNTPARSSDNPYVNFGDPDSDRDEWFNYIDNVSGKFDVDDTSLARSDVKDTNRFLQPDGIAGWAYDFKKTNEGDIPGDALALTRTVGNKWTGVTTQFVVPTTHMSFIAHITPAADSQVDDITKEMHEQYLDTFFQYGSAGFQADATAPFEVSLDRTTGQVIARIKSEHNKVHELTSTSSIPMDGVTPTCVIVTLDASISYGNLKLFINGKLEDLTGKSNTFVNNPNNVTTNNWVRNAGLGPGNSGEMSIGGFSKYEEIYNRASTRKFDRFAGKIEEVVWYPITIYPINPQSGETTIDKPFTEYKSDDDTTSTTLTARLFVKDYHNIRGKTNKHIGMSPAVHIRKSVPVLDGRTS